MKIQDKVVMNHGQHGHVAYFEGYVLVKYTEKGQMEPIAVTADKKFAEAYLDGKEEWPEDGVGVIRILALPMELEDDD
jgi:hypothetical protein